VGQVLTSLHHLDYLRYLFRSYLVGTIVLIALVGVKRSFHAASLTWGTATAVSSYAGVFCTLRALEFLKPQVVFPISLSGPIVLGVLLALFVFGEKIRPSGWAGIALAVAGITRLAIWK
jgi:drug/metabolite transporter (DMT)-like permease